MDLDDLTRRGLFDPDAPDAADRRALLELLVELGASADDMEAAARRGPLWQLAGQLAADDPPTIDARELARRSGFAVAVVDAIYAAFGVNLESHDELLFSESDVEVLTDLSTLTDTTMLEEAELADMFRVLGASLARVADAAVAMYLQGSERRLLEADTTDLERARAIVRTAARARSLPALLGTMLRHHLRLATDRQRRAQAKASDRSGFRLAVGFVDVVGFTPLSAELGPTELADLVSVFENASIDIVTRGGGQVVKHLGDEIMFVAVDADAACEIALRLIERFAGADLRARGGVSYGDLMIRRGDYYGPVVNLASRIVDQAVPGEVLVTTPVVDAVVPVLADPPALAFEPAGRRMLRGFADPVEVHSLARPSQPVPDGLIAAAR